MDESDSSASASFELRGNRPLLIDETLLRKLYGVIQTYGCKDPTVSFTVRSRLTRKVTLDELLAFDNPASNPISDVKMHLRERDPRRAFTVRLGTDVLSNMEIVVEGDAEMVDAAATEIQRVLEGGLPWYWWATMRADFALLPLLGAYAAAVTLAFALHKWPVVMAVVLVTSVAVFWAFFTWLQLRFFPRVYFRIGHGHQRYDAMERWRNLILFGVVVAFAVNVVAGIFVAGALP